MNPAATDLYELQCGPGAASEPTQLPIPQRGVNAAPPAKNKKPFSVVKEGSFASPIYKCADGRYSGTWYEGGKRRSMRRADPVELKEFLQRKLKDLADGKVYMANMTQADRAELECAKKNLLPTGKTIVLATAEYAESDKILDGASHVEAAIFFRQHRPNARIPAKTCREILEEMLPARKSDGRYKNTLDDYRSRLGRFADHFRCPIMNVCARDINNWLRVLPADDRKSKRDRLAGLATPVRYVSRRTRNNYRDAIRELYRFAKESGYLPRDWGVFADVVRVKNEPIIVKIFTPEQAAQLLAEAFPNLVPYLAIGFFATVRNEEMCPSDPKLPKLDWRQIDFKARRIHVLPDVARKTGRDRIIPMQRNLIAWLRPFAKPNGPICELKNVANALAATAVRAGIEWISNGPRKSSISYRLAILEDFKKTAFEAGTSEERILINYKKTVPKREAKRWYQIFPTPEAVIRLAQAA